MRPHHIYLLYITLSHKIRIRKALSQSQKMSYYEIFPFLFTCFAWILCSLCFKSITRVTYKNDSINKSKFYDYCNFLLKESSFCTYLSCCSRTKIMLDFWLLENYYFFILIHMMDAYNAFKTGFICLYKVVLWNNKRKRKMRKIWLDSIKELFCFSSWIPFQANFICCMKVKAFFVYYYGYVANMEKASKSW